MPPPSITIIIIFKFQNQVLGVKDVESAELLKNYFLLYASCIKCTRKFSDSSGEESGYRCTEHKIENFFVEQHMIPIILQQFLIDLDSMISSNTIEKYPRSEADLSVLHLIDANEIELFWNDYMLTIPNYLDCVWNTAVNGLLRYLQVCCESKQ